MKNNINEFLRILQHIDEYYSLHGRSRMGKDLSSQMCFANAAVKLPIMSIEELKVMVDLQTIDLQAIKFIYDKIFVSIEIDNAMQFILRNKCLAKDYIYDEYLKPLCKLKDLLLSV